MHTASHTHNNLFPRRTREENIEMLARRRSMRLCGLMVWERWAEEGGNFTLGSNVYCGKWTAASESMYKENISWPWRPPPTTEKFAPTQLHSQSQLWLFLRQSVMSSTQLREGQKTFDGMRMPTEEEWGKCDFLPARPSAEETEEVKECPLTNKREK